MQVATLQTNDRIKEKLQQTSGATATAAATEAARQGKPPAHSRLFVVIAAAPSLPLCSGCVWAGCESVAATAAESESGSGSGAGSVSGCEREKGEDWAPLRRVARCRIFGQRQRSRGEAGQFATAQLDFIVVVSLRFFFCAAW